MTNVCSDTFFINECVPIFRIILACVFIVLIGFHRNEFIYFDRDWGIFRNF